MKDQTMQTQHPQAINGKCSNCGSADLMLAQDFTDYSPCTWDADSGQWEKSYTDMQASEAHDAVRFFCTECGTQHAVPADLA